MADELNIDYSDLGKPAAEPAAQPGLNIDYSDLPKQGAPAGAQTQAPPPAAGAWGPGLHFLDAMLAGHYPWMAAHPGLGTAMAAGAAGDVGGAPQIAAETPGRQAELEAQREAWAKEHPKAAMATEAGGMAAATIPALMLQELALAPAAARLAPYAPGLVNFLRGTAGADRAGLGGVATRMASRAARGAAEGAESTALEKGARGEAPTFKDIAEGAAIGGIANPLMRGFMPRAVVDPNVAEARYLAGQPLHYPGGGAEAARRSLAFLERDAASRAALGGTVLGAGLLERYGGPAMHAVASHPAGIAAAGAVGLTGLTGAAANRAMASRWYQQRLYNALPAAAGFGGGPGLSRVNPLVPLATTGPMEWERMQGR